MSFYYIASPYSKYPGGIEQAFKDVCRETALLVKAGIPCFSPIAHSHPVAKYGIIDPLDHDIWLPADFGMMQAALGVIVCRLEDWDKSYGVSEEVKYFISAGKPVYYMDPGEVPDLAIQYLRKWGEE